MNRWAFVWKSSKQDIIKAEYIVTSNGSGLDQRSSLDELGVVPSIVTLIPMYWDNNEAIAQAMEPRSHQRDPNMFSDVYHLILEIIGRQDMKNERGPTDQIITDPLTKVLHQDSLINM